MYYFGFSFLVSSFFVRLDHWGDSQKKYAKMDYLALFLLFVVLWSSWRYVSKKPGVA